jgi:hypothetical protein
MHLIKISFKKEAVAALRYYSRIARSDCGGTRKSVRVAGLADKIRTGDLISIKQMF